MTTKQRYFGTQYDFWQESINWSVNICFIVLFLLLDTFYFITPVPLYIQKTTDFNFNAKMNESL